MKNSKIRKLILSAFFLSLGIWADGFRCDSPQGYLRVKIYNHTQSHTGGTRKVAVMILSNPKVPVGQRTIGVFHEAKGSLHKVDSAYTANFDFRFKSLSQAPHQFIKNISTRDLKKISISPNFNINEPIKQNANLNALMRLELRNGETISGLIKCRRYLKNKTAKKRRLKSCSNSLKRKLEQAEFNFSY